MNFAQYLLTPVQPYGLAGRKERSKVTTNSLLLPLMKPGVEVISADIARRIGLRSQVVNNAFSRLAKKGRCKDNGKCKSAYGVSKKWLWIE